MMQAEQIRLIIHQNQQLYALQTLDGKGYPLQAGYLNQYQIQQHIEGKNTPKVRLLQPRINTAKAGIDIDCLKDAQTLSSDSVLLWRSLLLRNGDTSFRYLTLSRNLENKSIDSLWFAKASSQVVLWLWYVGTEFGDVS